MRLTAFNSRHFDKQEIQMTSTDQQSWLRVKERLKAEVGDDIYSSWFARMDLDGLDGESVKLSVPTRFLKSWVQSHYAEKLLACWQAAQPSISRIELTVRSAVIRTAPPKKPPETQVVRHDTGKGNGEFRLPAAPISAAHEALGGPPPCPPPRFGTVCAG